VKIAIAVWKLLTALAECGTEHETFGTTHIAISAETYETHAVGDAVTFTAKVYVLGTKGIAACLKSAIDAYAVEP